MPHDRDRSLNSAEYEALAYAALGETARVQLAQAVAEPIAVPRPQPFDTVVVGVISGRPLKLDFTVHEVKTREIDRDDLILGFENGGKVVLKDYMHAFGMLGDQRTTIIQPDGKHYGFTELLSPTPAAKPETPAPGTRPDVVIVQKPAAGETERFKLSADKPIALNFGMNDIARSSVDQEGNLVVTFKDRAVLVFEGYAALKDSTNLSVYFAKGDKISLADLAPGGAPDTGAEGGHLFTQFAPGGTLGPLDHLTGLPPEPFSLIPPPGPPESPPPQTPPPPNVPPPPPHVDCKPPPCPPPPKDCEPPPKDCEPPKKDCEPPHKPVDCRPPPICEPPVKDCGPDPKDHQGSDDGKGQHGKLPWVVALGCEVGGDTQGEHGRWGERAQDDHGGKHGALAEAMQRGWSDGHDQEAAHHVPHERGLHAEHDAHGLWMHQGEAGDRHGSGMEHAALGGKGEHDGGWNGDHGHREQAGLHERGAEGHGHESHGAPMSSHDLFDSGAHAGHAAGGHGAGHFAAAHDFAAVMAHSESHAPQIQNHTQHNVMGHG